MKIKKNSKRAFTLAEVLIALTIIGVIAAITVPALIQRTNKQEYVTALQKAYSTFSQAANQIIAENGSPKCDDEGWACSTKEVYEAFKNKLRLSKDCGSSSGCFPHLNKSLYKSLTNDRGRSGNWDADTNMYKIIIEGGMLAAFSDVSSSCIMESKGGIGSTEHGYENGCARILLDVNGEKAPNTRGRDVFSFVIKENGLYPSGCGFENLCAKGKVGYACTCRVLREEAMNY